jgi:hypothetical protein
LKCAIIEASIYTDVKYGFKYNTSDIGVGAVLSQAKDNGGKHPY